MATEDVFISAKFDLLIPRYNCQEYGTTINYMIVKDIKISAFYVGIKNESSDKSFECESFFVSLLLY